MPTDRLSSHLRRRPRNRRNTELERRLVDRRSYSGSDFTDRTIETELFKGIEFTTVYRSEKRPKDKRLAGELTLLRKP